MYRSGKGVAADPARALALLEKGCENGTPTACFAAGKMHESGETGTKDPARAVELLQKACEKGVGPGCEKRSAPEP